MVVNQHFLTEKGEVVSKGIVTVLFLVLVIFGASIGCSPQQKEEGKIRIGSLPMVASLPAYVAYQEGLFEKQGVQVEIVPFRSTVELKTALFTGDLDGLIGEIFWVVSLNVNEKTSKLVGCDFMPRTFELVASSGSGINSPSQLKGKEIAVATSTVVDYALERFLRTNGLNPGDIVKANIPSMPLRLESLNQGKVPVAIFTPPLSDLAVLNGGRVIIDDVEHPFAGSGLIFSLKSLADKPNTVTSSIQAWHQAVELINANPEKYRGTLNEIASVPEVLSQSLKVPAFGKLEAPDKEEFKLVVDWFIKKELMSKKLAYEEVVETSYLSQ